jgi:bacillolysin
MSRVFIQHKYARWLVLVSVLTLLGTPLLATAQGGSAASSAAASGATGLAAKITTGSAPLTATPSRAGDRSLRPLKSDDGAATLAGSEPAIKGQLLTAVKQALRAAGATDKGKYARISGAQRQQLASLSAARKADAGFGVRFNPAAGTPALIKLSPPKASTGLRAGTLSDGASAARSFMRQNKVLLGMADPDSDMDLARQWQDPLGSRHFRYQQQVAGIPVWGREALVHVDGNDTVYLYQGHTVKSAAQTTANTAQINADEAFLAAQADLGGTAVASADNPDQLVYYPESEDDLVLCYQIAVETDLADRWWYFIDAASGEVVHRISRVADTVESASGSSLLGVTRSFNAWLDGGTYYLVDPTIPDAAYDDPVASISAKGNLYVFDARNGESDLYYIASTSATSGWDPAGVSVIYNIEQVYDYYKDTHGRDGIDNANMNYQAVVHLKQNYANAFWNGTFLVFGDGDNQTFSNLAASLDITAHEIQHGVTEFTAGLIYENQSGALNEAYSDIFACMVDRDDWTVGEDVTLVSPGFLRDLAHPENGLDPLPTKMSEYRNMPVDEDHGGVHINMSIPSRAAYLIAEGLTTEGLGTAIGRDKTERIFYRALTTYLTASSNFADGRSATIQAAEDLYGAGSAEVTAVGAGWDGVEVFADGGGTPDNPNPTPGDPVSGDDLMVYLQPVDGSHNSSSESFDVYVQTLPSPFSSYSPSQDSSDLNPSVYAFYNKPAAFSAGDETLVLYVGADNDLYGVYADGSNHTQISDRGDIYSIALSPNGRYFAYTTTSAADNNIYVGDLESQETTLYELVSPTTEHPGDSSQFNTIFYADSLSFDYTSSLIVFDALNCISTVDSDCSDTNGGYRYWSIGIIDLNDGSILYPFPNQNPDFDLSYPTFAANNSYVIALDETDRTEVSTSGTIGTMVWTYNWNDGTSHEIIDPNQGSTDRIVFGVPSFWGDDDYLTVQRRTDTNGTAYRVPITSDWARGTENLVQINDNDVAMPIMHRTGTRDLDTDLSLSSSSLSFGSVTPGSNSSLGVTLTNNGERDIKITGISSSSTYFTHNGANTLLPRNESMTITVTYLAPTSEGSQSGTLTITSNADTSTRTISLSGQSGSGGGGGGDSSGGGCFVKSLQAAKK